MQLQHEIMKRFFATPAMKKIEAEIVTENNDERQEKVTRLAKLKREREEAVVAPTRKLFDAKQLVAELITTELPRRQAAAAAADAELGRARGLHFAEIRKLEAELTKLAASESVTA